MINTQTESVFEQELKSISEAGLYKEERIIETPQGALITSNGKEVLNFCANNYLGLANNKEIINAAKKGLDEHGYGLSSTRFICGTQDIHKALEKKVAKFLGLEDAILYSSCFDANAGLFETLLGKDDAIISDELNHASIIDGIRLCKAKRLRYKNNDMKDLEARLKEASDSKIKLIVTDGVFSMDGILSNLQGICDLAEQFGAMVMVDDSHASGFIGDHGRGTIEYWKVEERVDIITSTFGKALGGASGGFTASKEIIVSLLRQRSRPYLFSNTLPPMIVNATLEALDLIQEATELRKRLEDNTKHFREGMQRAGFDIIEGSHPIVPVMIYDAIKAKSLATALLEKGFYVIAFSYPVVPKEKARIRVQLSAAHTTEQVQHAIEAFTEAGKATGIL